MYIKLLSTGACANINIREIMLISIISSASWTLQEREREGGRGETERQTDRQREIKTERVLGF